MSTAMQWGLLVPVILIEITALWKFMNSTFFEDWLAIKAEELKSRIEPGFPGWCEFGDCGIKKAKSEHRYCQYHMRELLIERSKQSRFAEYMKNEKEDS